MHLSRLPCLCPIVHAAPNVRFALYASKAQHGVYVRYALSGQLSPCVTIFDSFTREKTV